jgi:hypothetical protein
MSDGSFLVAQYFGSREIRDRRGYLRCGRESGEDMKKGKSSISKAR